MIKTIDMTGVYRISISMLAISAEFGGQLGVFVTQLVESSRDKSKSEVLCECLLIMQDQETKLAAMHAGIE